MLERIQRDEVNDAGGQRQRDEANDVQREVAQARYGQENRFERGEQKQSGGALTARQTAIRSRHDKGAA